MKGEAAQETLAAEETVRPLGRLDGHAHWEAVKDVPVRLVVKIPLRGMNLRRLRGLKAGSVVQSEWPAAEEVPLYAADVTLSWCEFAVVNEVIAARLTRLG